MNNKKGFTLIEIIGTLVILTLISLLIVPNIIAIINQSRYSIDDEQFRTIVRSARSWFNNNLSWIEAERDICVGVSELMDQGYIESNKLISPLSKETLNGVISIKYDSSAKKHVYTYDKECDVEMAKLRLEVPSNTFNTKGWANKDIEVKIIGDKNTAKYRYCVSSIGECTPTIEQNGSSGKVVVSTQGTNNYVCAKAVRASGEVSKETVCNEKAYKLDKTAPTLNVPGNTSITNKVFNFNLMEGVTATDNYSSEADLKIEASGSLSYGIPGNYVITYRAIDAAGNITTKTRTITVSLADDGIPTLVLTLVGSPLNNVGWSKTNINISVNAIDTRVGIKNYKFCTSTVGVCIPSTTVNASSGTVTITAEGIANYLCANAENNNSIVNDTVCVGPYKIDKTPPVLNIPGDTRLSQRETILDLRLGTTYSDNFTAVNDLTFSLSGSLSFGIFGVYPITYRVTDVAGNVTTKVRNVQIDDMEKPTLTLAVDNSSFNTKNWANKNINVQVSTDDGDGIGVKSYTYCTSTSPNCTPTTVVTGSIGNFSISTESTTNYACAIATDYSDNISDKVCVGPYKLDKNPPILTVPGTIYLTQRDNTVNVLGGVTATDNFTPNGEITITTMGSASLGIFGNYIVAITATDAAGNSTTQERTIVVGDTDAPTISIAVTGAFNTNQYANRNITANITTDDSDGIGVKSYTYCTTTGATCTPTIEVNGIEGTIEFGADSNTNYICAISTDHSNNVSERVCRGPYKVDKVAPTLNVPDATTISVTATSFDINAGVTYSDNLTATGSLNYTVSGSVSLGISGVYIITYTVTDLAGNITTKTREVQIANDIPPIVTLAVVGNPFNAAGWAKANFNISVSTTSQYGEVLGYTYCTSTTGQCTPNTEVEAINGTITISAESATNYVCAIATDDSGNESSRVCSGPHKLDKTNPTCGTIAISGTAGNLVGTVQWYKSNVTISHNASDSLSQIKTATLSHTAINSEVWNTTISLNVIDNADNTCSTSRVIGIEYGVSLAIDKPKMDAAISSRGRALFNTSKPYVNTFSTTYQGTGYNYPSSTWYARSCEYVGGWDEYFNATGKSVSAGGTIALLDSQIQHKSTWTKGCGAVHCGSTTWNWNTLDDTGGTIYRYTRVYETPAGNYSNEISLLVEYVGKCGYTP